MNNLAHCENWLEKQVMNFANYIKNCKGNSENLVSLIDRIGATIAGVKPAELLNFPSNNNCSNISWENCKDCILKNSNVKMRVVNRHKKRIHVFFYHEQELKKVINQPEVVEFLRELGYPIKCSFEDCLEYLMIKLNSDEFPHEIGIFLGYPLKDVKGYLGKNNLNYVCSNGWKVYGNKYISQKRFKSFREARYKVRRQLNTLLENRVQIN